MSDVVAPAAPAPSSTPTASVTSAPAPTSAPSPGQTAPTSAPGTPASATQPNSKFADQAAEGKTPTPAEKAAAEVARRKYQLKVDGKTQELELADDEVSVRLQKAMAAEKRMQEAAQVRKDFQSIVEAIKKDPFSALKDPAFGLDLEQLAIERLKQEYEEAQLPEGERKMRAYEREIQQYKQRDEMQKAQVRQQQQAAYEQRIHQEMERDFAEALQTESLPKNRQTLYMMAEVAKTALEHGIELTPKQLASEVNGRLRGINQHVVTNLKGEQLAKYLGDDVVREIVRYSINRVRPTQPTPFEPPAPKTPIADVDDGKPERQIKNPRDVKRALGL